MKSKSLLLVSILTIGMLSCQKDSNINSLDQRLQNRLEALSSEGLDYFVLPSSTDFNKIPQDPNNPITQAKVELGRFLFHETELAKNPNMDIGMKMYSCAR